MRHATQARFDRVARGELQRPAYTEAQMLNWTETDFNWHMREALRAQDLRALHIREASETGVADLMVYRCNVPRTMLHQEGPRKGTQESCQIVEAWIELKSENNKAKYMMDQRKAAQRQFMREHWALGQNAIYVMMDRKACMLAAHQGDLTGVVKMLPMSPYSVDWPAVFSHFKSRC